MSTDVRIGFTSDVIVLPRIEMLKDSDFDFSKKREETHSWSSQRFPLRSSNFMSLEFKIPLYVNTMTPTRKLFVSTPWIIHNKERIDPPDTWMRSVKGVSFCNKFQKKSLISYLKVFCRKKFLMSSYWN